MPSDSGFFDGVIEDGRPLLMLTGVALIASGAFALFLSVRREFLPHDVHFLGLSAAQLCALHDCRVVGFMFHDRVAFGGALGAIGTLYLWLSAFPLRQGQRWAWHALAVSGAFGFASFLAYLGYGYLDSWHGVATMALLPCFVYGLWRTSALARTSTTGWLLTPDARASSKVARLGRMCLLATSAGMILGGATILAVGMTTVFVPSDLAFIGATRLELMAASPRLIPLIAHDRAGFGGGLASSGLLVALCAWYAPPSRSFWQAFAIAGVAGFGCAIGVHFVEGYTDTLHIAPAVAGAILFACGRGLEVAGTMSRRVQA